MGLCLIKLTATSLCQETSGSNLADSYPILPSFQLWMLVKQILYVQSGIGAWTPQGLYPIPIQYLRVQDPGLWSLQELVGFNLNLESTTTNLVDRQITYSPNLFNPQVKESGKIKRVRGTVFALRVSPAITNRIVEAAKGELLHFLPDVFLSVDHRKGKQSGKSPGQSVST